MIRWTNFPLCFRVAWRELRAIGHSYSVLLVLLGGVFVYGLLYNYMYAPNVVYDVPVAVVDHSHSALSRQYVRLFDATPQVAVVCELPDMGAAKQLMQQGEVFGILYLPDDFETQFYEGRQAIYPFYASTDAFLYYESLEKANLQVMEAMDSEYRTQLLPLLSLPGLAAVATQSPVTVIGTALYNPTEGYGIYLIPSVLMIIVFQTLMMLVAMMTGNECRGRELQAYARLHSGRWGIALALVCGKSLAYGVLYGVFAFFLTGFLPLIFEIPHAASGLGLMVLMVPYILSTSFLGLALSRWYTDPEAPILLIAFFSIGLIFLSGVSYPLELIPWYWQIAHCLIPAAPAVLAFVKLSSMEASLHDITPELAMLCVQTTVYFLLAVVVYYRKLFRFYR